MTAEDRLNLLRRAVGETSQAEAARAIGYSPAVVSQVLSGTYRGDVAAVLERVAETYGAETIVCPVCGVIPLGRCAENRRKPFSSANPQSVRLARVCPRCPERRGAWER